MEWSDAEIRLNRREVAARMRLHTPDYRYDNSYEAFGPYTGYKETIGYGRTYNSPLSAMQLSTVLAAGNHPRIDDLLACAPSPHYIPNKEKREEEIRKVREAVRAMVGEKVLSGMKILDIGCGPFPSFTRCARALGARVYTMDMSFGVDQFWGTEEFKAEHGAAEAEHHMVLSICDDKADEIIRERTGGNLDVVTWSHLTSEWKIDRWKGMNSDGLKSRAMGLLKENGWMIPLPMEDGLMITQRTNIAP